MTTVKKVCLTIMKLLTWMQNEKYALQLEHVSNDTMRELTTEQLNEIDETLDNIILDLQSNEVDLRGTIIYRRLMPLLYNMHKS